MSWNDKLEQWRNKTEREKHSIAMVGAIVLTVLVTVAWAYTFSVTLGDKTEIAINTEYNKRFSPLASLKNFFTENIERVKISGGAVKDSASVIFGGSEIPN